MILALVDEAEIDLCQGELWSQLTRNVLSGTRRRR